MRIEVKAGDVTVSFRGFGLRKRLAECAWTVIEIAKELGDPGPVEEPKRAFGFMAAGTLADGEIAPIDVDEVVG